MSADDRLLVTVQDGEALQVVEDRVAGVPLVIVGELRVWAPVEGCGQRLAPLVEVRFEPCDARGAEGVRVVDDVDREVLAEFAELLFLDPPAQRRRGGRAAAGPTGNRR